MIKWWEFKKRSRCPHVHVEGIYGDQIIFAGWSRLYCRDCGKLLDGPVSIAVDRQELIRRQMSEGYEI